MANTIVKDGNFINITFDGATAWDCTTSSGLTADVANGLRIKSIQMIPAATDNVLTVRSGGSSGVVIFKGKAANAYDWKHLPINASDKRHKLYVVGNEATSGVMMIVEI